ncbi:hypothetical protein CIB84_015799 [Bambusicola thoracicus]|uniref:Uncharacterized protein n=1 Tax=Bambusicola thoracicus TaxID=9083 RepID=A0A2P4S8N3_BAMTH|nr:hypothetical protein CIB84_015799 [Bambusicola thoracicus]
MAVKKEVGGSQKCFGLLKLSGTWRPPHFHLASFTTAHSHLKFRYVTISSTLLLFILILSLSVMWLCNANGNQHFVILKELW